MIGVPAELIIGLGHTIYSNQSAAGHGTLIAHDLS